ncbi:MAG: NAD(P)H-dependent oxidoreductase [Firmicutes bacterium]|nr:NAD(P)H-dependent oxidoreductase [Bacillota bacterium]
MDLYPPHIPPLDHETLRKREQYIAENDFSHAMFDYAKQFQAADDIVIAAPYWDLSFPAVLKCYLEAVCVNGLTFQYNAHGVPQGLCRAQRLIYVTTAGGHIPAHNFGFDYIRQLCTDFFGVGRALCIKAEGLDIWGADVDGILQAAKAEINAAF